LLTPAEIVEDTQKASLRLGAAEPGFGVRGGLRKELHAMLCLAWMELGWWAPHGRSAICGPGWALLLISVRNNEPHCHSLPHLMPALWSTAAPQSPRERRKTKPPQNKHWAQKPSV